MLARQLAVVGMVVSLFSSSFAQSNTTPPSQASTTPATEPASPASPSTKGFVLQDGTPLRLRTGRTISSGDAHVGDTLDFEVLEAVSVDGVLVVPKGGIAFATVTEAQAKRRMARGGKLDINIDSVRLVTGEKAALRAVKDGNGGGHTGAMVGGMVATSLVFFPAAPFFLFMHGKDITIPKGTELTAYVSGDMKLDRAKFEVAQSQPIPPTTGDASNSAAPPATPAATEIEISSTPDGADIEIDGRFVGSTLQPSDQLQDSIRLLSRKAASSLGRRTLPSPVATSKSMPRSKPLRNELEHSASSELQMKPHPRHPHRPTIPVVPRIIDMLQIRPNKKSPPNMQVVIALDNIFAAVIQSAVA
jgi:hypothetical protein